MPKRIQMSRQRPWRADNPDAIKVDRSTPFGNPYAVAPCVDRWRGWRLVSSLGGDVVGPVFPTRAAAIAEAVKRHRAWATKRPEMFAGLAGHDLACWCPPDGPCHADVLLEIANG